MTPQEQALFHRIAQKYIYTRAILRYMGETKLLEAVKCQK
jgi:hypothetical protein